MSSINSGLKLLLKRLEVRLLRRHRPDLFILESEAMRQMAVCGRGIPAADTAVVHTGVDAGKFRPLPDAVGLMHARFGIPRNRRVVVYMGHLHERKGVQVLMQAMDHVVNQRSRKDMHAVFLGNRNGEETVFRKFWEPAATHITFGGYQSDIPELMAGCFADGAVVQLGEAINMTAAEYITMSGQTLPTIGATQHHLGLPLIHIQGVPPAKNFLSAVI